MKKLTLIMLCLAAAATVSAQVPVKDTVKTQSDSVKVSRAELNSLIKTVETIVEKSHDISMADGLPLVGKLEAFEQKTLGKKPAKKEK